MNDNRYVMDSNALSTLSRRQRESSFFRMRCRIPSEVLHEASGFPDIVALRNNVYPTTDRILEILIEVMATVPANDTKLVDLYANRGNADPLVVACALEGKREGEGMLFSPTWVVVSSDKAVQAKATEFGIEVRTSDEFSRILSG